MSAFRKSHLTKSNKKLNLFTLTVLRIEFFRNVIRSCLSGVSVEKAVFFKKIHKASPGDKGMGESNMMKIKQF